ncbi:innexin shaking-B-like [Limulus polyphemus]|uniref:Innexin n=1 Tax=Limulus polyphemus TaxID=6850 RepID=A0ABM1C3D7_LIMPO|nr:innexin shaking-B-like [Limulus polyphemus]
MIYLFQAFKGLVKVRPVSIDNTVFRLHWLFTTVFLLAFSILVTTSQYVGNPIHCMPIGGVPDDLLESFCWIHSTFSVSKAFNLPVSQEIPYPGVSNSNGVSERNYHSYYQWVGFVLFLQALLFYTPYYLWKIWEGRLLVTICNIIQIVIVSDEELRKKTADLTHYILKHRGHHKYYAFKYFLCELLCLMNVIGQFYLLDLFLDGRFFTYGFELMQFSQRDQKDVVDPMTSAFPRMTKCEFHVYGSSGDVRKHNSLCLLPQNIVNEKIYIFMWFWFVILTTSTILVLCSRLGVICVFKVRLYFLRSRFRFTEEEQLRIISQNVDIGDWFLLYMLGQNVDQLILRETVEELVKVLETRNKASLPNVV